MRFSSPTIKRVDVPSYITLPRTRLTVAFDILGTRFIRKGDHSITASLVSDDGRAHITETLDLAGAATVMLDTSTLTPGRYRLNLTIVDADGTVCVQAAQSMEAINGPLAL